MGHRAWKWWAGLLGAAMALRLFIALVLLGEMPLVSDAREYFDVAVRMASGGFRGAFYWPPGESIVLACALAPFGKSVLVARLVTVAIGTATVALSALLARELAGGEAGAIAGWIAALYAPSALLSGQSYAQHLAALCLAAFAYFGLRALREQHLTLFAATGAALGLGCLTRPSMASVAPILVAACAIMAHLRRESLRRLVPGALLTAFITLALVVPVQAYNSRLGAGWAISTNNERNLLLGNNPYTPDYKTSHLGQRTLDELTPDARSYLESLYSRPDARSAMQRAAWMYMTHHPLRTAWRTLNRATSFWGFDYLASREIQRWATWQTREVLPVLALEAGSYVTVAVLALAGLVALSGACAAPVRLWLVAVALAYQAPYAIAFSGGTYHFPVMPLVVPFAAVAIANGVKVWRAARETRGTIVALGAFAAIQTQYAYFALTMSPEEPSHTKTGHFVSSQDAPGIDRDLQHSRARRNAPGPLARLQ
jgi:4-amino-4-deoxy-L-arabinose transferase-like glycosyltransferase